jgi:hypothetical protein
VEFELDFREDQATWIVGIFLTIALVLFGLGKIGKPLTPYMGSSARVMGWSDWTLHKAEKIYTTEIAILRRDVELLTQVLEAKSNPVQVSLLVKQIGRDVVEGTPALASARAAVAQATLDVGDWSIGVLEREKAIQSLEIAIALLSE